MHTPLAPYAARLNVDYPQQLDRLSTFFRLIWVIPIALVLALLGGLSTPAQPTLAAQPSSDTPVGEQLAWTFDLLNTRAGALTEADLATRFTPALLAAVPPPQLLGFAQQLASAGPFTFQGFTRPPQPTQAVALVLGTGGLPFALSLSVEGSEPHRITGLGLVPVPAPAGVVLQPFSTDAEPDRVDGRVDIGGRSLYLTCRGTGSPTVVLESGLTDLAAPWFAVESAVAGFTRVCSYDRANAFGGASDPAPTPRTGSQMASDLHAVLETAEVPGPFVLVGHSIGGHVVRLYAAQNPAAVAGLVLVDASHEDQDARLQALIGPELWASRQQALAQGNSEGVALETIAAEVRSAPGPGGLPPTPLIVLTRGLPGDPSMFPPGWPVEAEAQLWRELQADLAGRVPGGRQVVAQHSGHYIHQSEPGLVVEAIREVVGAARQANQTGK